MRRAKWLIVIELWQRYRWLLFVIGTTFAAILTHFVATGMFHPGNAIG